MAVTSTNPDRTSRNYTSNLVVREQSSRQREADADAQNLQLPVEAARQRHPLIRILATLAKSIPAALLAYAMAGTPNEL
jgi:hypothetical protein